MVFQLFHKQILKNGLCITCTRRQKKRKHRIANYSALSLSLPCVLAMGSLTSTASLWLVYKLQPGPWFTTQSVQHPTVKNFKPSLSLSSFTGTEPVSSCFKQGHITTWQAQHSIDLFKAGLISYRVHRNTCTRVVVVSTTHTYMRQEKAKSIGFIFMARLGHVLNPCMKLHLHCQQSSVFSP